MRKRVWLPKSAPRHRRGRKALIGVRARMFEPRGMIGPWAERLYAVEPAGVATMMPSQTSSGRRLTPSISMLSAAAWRVSRKTETSLMATPSTVSPAAVSARMRSAKSSTGLARASRASRSSGAYSLSRKPTVPRFIP